MAFVASLDIVPERKNVPIDVDVDTFDIWAGKIANRQLDIDLAEQQRIADEATRLAQLEADQLREEQLRNEEARLRLERLEQEENEALNQRPAPFQFGLRQGKIVGVALESSLRSTFGEDLRIVLKDKATSARLRLEHAQVPRHVLVSFDRLIESLADGLSNVRPGVLLGRARSLEAALTSVEVEALFSDSVAEVTDVRDSLGDFLAFFPEIIKIEAARVAQRVAAGEMEDAYQNAVEAKTIAGQSEVVHETAVWALSDSIKDIEQASMAMDTAPSDVQRAKANEYRANLVADLLLSVRNFAASAVREGDREAGLYGQDDVIRIREGTAEAVEAGTRTGLNSSFVGLVFSLGPSIAALGQMVGSFGPLARRAGKITGRVAAPR